MFAAYLRRLSFVDGGKAVHIGRSALNCRIVVSLQVQPKLRLNLEYLAKGHSRFGRYPAPATNDLADAHSVQAALGCQFIQAKPERNQALLVLC
jgi:hypothetical protein